MDSRQENINKLKKLYEEQSFEQAFALSKGLVEQGEHDAICFQADCYFFGYYVEKDINKAIELYNLALTKGSYKAGISLASYYEPDITDPIIGSEKNREKSVHFYSNALALAIQSEKNNDCEAMYYLGLIYDSGLSVPENKKLALKWYEKAYENGYEFALNKLCEFYSSDQFYDERKFKKYGKLLNESRLRVV